MKITFIFTLLVMLICNFSYSADNLTIKTKSTDFFENFISDTTLLLDQDLKKIVSIDYYNVVNKSKFSTIANSWRPQPDPKVALKNIFNKIDQENINETLSDLVKPVVEIACTPQQYDPFNKIKQYCINNMLNYPIIETFDIKYNYNQNKVIDQYISDITNLKDNNRYQQMITTTASIMNKAYSNVAKKNITKSVNIVKIPYELLDPIKKDVTINKEKGLANPQTATTDSEKVAKCVKSCESDYDICVMNCDSSGFSDIGKTHCAQPCSRRLPSCKQACERSSTRMQGFNNR